MVVTKPLSLEYLKTKTLYLNKLTPDLNDF